LGFRLLRIEPQYIKKEGTYYDLWYLKKNGSID
jgi:hypothetical protein